MKQKRDGVLQAIQPHIGRRIRVTTIDGHTHEGVLLNADGRHIYLHTDPYGQPGLQRPIYTPAQYNQIMTLVLFELLVILLLA
ncbi:LSm family protein [Paenibacillus roseipurpureus]|uniref:Acetyl-CoA acetyltransferase n=1 Tax=Paenibacillus roseopurpureus TaxID=2918901 RepID=A0AA96RKP2_9BACL|nr:acetyl-CoA acetyltransferase [Paenibacillus sp. MBLB1832]WNR44945.1 acetyl-CoA acetyltransferase [Paenibacillus sp. MBLB1832]